MPNIKFFDEFEDSISVRPIEQLSENQVELTIIYHTKPVDVLLDIPTAIQFSKELRKAIAVAKNPK